MLSHKRNTSGFTIVELLIVIVVIGILAAITIVAYNGVQQKARDSQRVSDLKKLQTYVEMYIADKGESPITTEGCHAAKSFTSTNCELLSTLADINTITNGAPSDPKNSADYNYGYRRGYMKNAAGDGVQGGAGADGYIILGRLESSTAPTFTFNNSTYNYILSNKSP